ncbi:hypothetical protein SASPL_156150 [Salvia splendens]|uniref:Uncharacterized protein n=1 Tax=Salvia splendens TaxID=180675 RepID=A0A8X8VXC5_SALSN|nr:hypothetical protein SASPL_156150 [Salvia splendens]
MKDVGYGSSAITYNNIMANRLEFFGERSDLSGMEKLLDKMESLIDIFFDWRPYSMAAFQFIKADKKKFATSPRPLKFHSLFFSSDVQFFFQKVLLEHSYQPHDTILENQKPKRVVKQFDHAKRLKEDLMLLLRGLSCVHVDSLWFMDMALVALPENRAEVDQIGYDIMQQRSDIHHGETSSEHGLKTEVEKMG